MQQFEFDQPGMAALLAQMDDSALDSLGFGVIGFDQDGKVRRYNRFESQAAGLGVERVLQQDLFTVVAPCMNNFLVAQRFIDARDAGVALDETMPYVLTLRMRPTRVHLRLLSAPRDALAYVLVQRL
ncbi:MULTISPECIES: phosphonate transporter [unclassified Duganella]|uniref:phosphonate transporter n=1 Tax=unclassified Duganella TaxID=2636909 RepID=UPI0008741C91|nr:MULTISPECIES: phosphonate transporter [unclassified Duganella]OEZ63506.1 photoactive yellow protein [Duganella sp. HH105]OEZ94848.1 photoactive yellow protein [Duganella sp. HH101]OEZ94849.1 photoactive yellow protein [Duganella sp. HH101]